MLSLANELVFQTTNSCCYIYFPGSTKNEADEDDDEEDGEDDDLENANLEEPDEEDPAIYSNNEYSSDSEYSGECEKK
jgi:hypothetical protein